MNNKKINETIEQYKNICKKIQELGKEQERATTLNTINDYLIILQDERIAKNYKNNNNCYNLINTICEEVKEYNNNDLIDYYEEETATAIHKSYLKTIKEITNDKRDLKKLYLVFYLNDKELLSYDLINEFYGERQETLNLLAYENNCKIEDITIKKEWRQ